MECNWKGSWDRWKDRSSDLKRWGWSGWQDGGSGNRGSGGMGLKILGSKISRIDLMCRMKESSLFHAMTMQCFFFFFLPSLLLPSLPSVLSFHAFIYSFIEKHLLNAACCCWVTSVVSDSVQLHRRQPTRMPCPWDSPGKNTGVGCHFLLQCMQVKSESEVAQSCPTLSNPMDCSLPGSSIHGIFQARVLEWGAIAFK